MEIVIEDKTIASVDFSNAETAWKIEEAIYVLEYLRNENKIVLGGDILTKNLEHNYDSWYYNIERDKSALFNVEKSSHIAIEYILNYIRVKGNAFFVIFVVE